MHKKGESISQLSTLNSQLLYYCAGAGAGAFYWSEATSPPLSKGDLGGMSKSLRQRHKKKEGRTLL